MRALEVETTSETGLDATGYVRCELIRSINGNRLIHRLGAVSPDVSSRVATVVKTLLGH